MHFQQTRNGLTIPLFETATHQKMLITQKTYAQQCVTVVEKRLEKKKKEFFGEKNVKRIIKKGPMMSIWI